MNLCNYYDRLEIEDGELVRVINAVPRAAKKSHLSLDVYKEYESGRCQCRNLYSSMTGYRVAFPDEVTSLYHNGSCSFIQKLEDFGDISRIPAFYYYSGGVDKISQKLILEKYPDFKYVMKKWSGTLAQTIDALAIWHDHKDVEFLLAAGWTKLALNKSFWRMSEKKRKEIVSFKKNNPECRGMSLSDIQKILKYGISVDEFREYEKFCWRHSQTRYDVYKYLQKIGKADFLGVSLYRDYWKLLKQTEHNKNDDYWKYPKDLQRKHDELLQEVENINQMKQIQSLKEKQERYSKVVKKLLKYGTEIDGYSVFVPETVEQIAEQAKVLHQCLVANDYVSKVINKSCVLVFIQKDSVPIATCQLLKGDKIGQFYADELDRDNCLPTDEVMAVMNKWIEWKKNSAETKRRAA